MTFRHIPLAACALIALAGIPAQAGAQAPDASVSTARPEGVPKKTQDAVRAALVKIGAEPDAHLALMDLVRAHDSARVRGMLIQYGVLPSQLRHVVVDALGSTLGARIPNPLTIYFDVIPAGGNVPEPVGLIYMGYPYGWVDFDTFDPTWYWY